MRLTFRNSGEVKVLGDSAECDGAYMQVYDFEAGERIDTLEFFGEGSGGD